MISTHRKQPFSPAEFEEIFSKVPRTCVDLVIQTPTGIVMIKRKADSWPGLWHVPGGMVFYREKIQDAITRVAEEELGITVQGRKLIGYMEFFSEIKERGFGFSVSHVFLCSTENEIPGVNQSGEKVKIWDAIPEKIIAEHAVFLREKGMLK